MASCRAITDCGTTRRSVVGAPWFCSGSGSASAGGSTPVASSISRLSRFAASETAASSASSASSEVSRAAVLARIVAMPSSRFIWAVR